MKTKTNDAAPSEPKLTDSTAEPSIFTPADRKRLKKMLSKESFAELMQLVDGDPVPLPLIGSDGNEIHRDSMDEIAIKSWHDGNEEYIYQIGKSVYAYYDDRSNFLVYEESHVTCVIEYSYPREDGYQEERCVQFEVKPPLRFAKRGYNGFCRVWINTFYRDAYLRANDLSGWAREENGEIIEFESYSVARKWINQDKEKHYTNGMYHFKYNEYDYRQYKICE